MKTHHFLLITVTCYLLTGSTQAYWGRYFRECLDVAIVGGGIGGTYTGWRLRTRDLKISIFENTDRIGGRIFSMFLPSVPNVPVELGAMRYTKGVHTRLEDLITKLGLQSQVFRPDQSEKLYYFRGVRLSGEQLDSSKLPYNLAPSESRNGRQLKWTLAQKALNTTEPDKIPDVEEALTQDGVPVYQQGFLNLLNKVWTNEAKEYLKHVDTFWSLYDSDLNAVHRAIPSNPASPSTESWTVVGGMNMVCQRLAEQFTSANNRKQIKLNRRIGAVQKVWNGQRHVYQLTVHETETVDGITRDKSTRPYSVCAERVILALPPRALKNIWWTPLQNHASVREALSAVNDYEAMKIFLAYPNAWWDNTNAKKKSFVTDLPLRQGGEFGRFRNSSEQEPAMMMVSYADGKATSDLWRGLRKLGNNISSPAVPAAFLVSKAVVEHVHHHLAAVYDVSPSSIPWPLDGAMHIWDDAVNGRAWQLFKPGYKPKRVSTFMRQPSSSDKVFIITNAFASIGLVETSLKAADEVLGEFFGME